MVKSEEINKNIEKNAKMMEERNINNRADWKRTRKEGEMKGM